MAPRRKWVRKIPDAELDPCRDDDTDTLLRKMQLAKQRLASVRGSIQSLHDALAASSGREDSESMASRSELVLPSEGIIQRLMAGAPAKELFHLLHNECVTFTNANCWSNSRSALQSTIFDLVKCIIVAVSQDPNREVVLEEVRHVLRGFCESAEEDTYAQLFQTGCILVSSCALGTDFLCRVNTPTFRMECPHLKAFVYPYLVSNRFRHAMVTLATEITSKFEVGRESVSLDASITSWKSPKLLKVIEESFSSWSVVKFSEPILSAMHAEAVTAISLENADMSTIICERRLPSIGRLERSLSSSEIREDDCLDWEKILALELLLHEFCRIWRRMLEPKHDYSTPRGVGSYDKPNAGCMMDGLLWGPFLSTDVRHATDRIVLCERENTSNMKRALSIESWDDPEATFFWIDQPLHAVPKVVTAHVSLSEDGRRRMHGPLVDSRFFLSSGTRRRYASRSDSTVTFQESI
eukprot:TRINITY_DN16876_c0_g8_i1.p1 TRINITY_DN16876_c0_g8~~TRINITY_DN16876_c0_g8_i1.p1  ORF type:complete len:468 (+),score=46.90 TRINITY_DN16876_c0_g8_i1:74-1477(+)